MTDLFTETHAERAAIMQFDGGAEQQAAESMATADTARHLHECEVRSVVRMYREQGSEAVKAFLSQVEKARGKEAMERLRVDSLAALKK